MESQRLLPDEALLRLRSAGIDVVRERTGDGTEIRCRCPRHEDPNGHLYVNAATGATFCQKCQLRTHIAALCGDRMSGTPDPRSDILAATAAHYHSCLSEDARRYLIEERGLTLEVLERFQVGWAGGGLRKHLLEEKGFTAEACVAAGVLKEDEQRGLRDFFYRRIVFPNTVGARTVHLSGRRLGEGEGPKWLHLRGEVVHPFNADALQQSGCVWTEGILDVISLACWDIPAVAGLGTHIKDEWVTGLPEAHRVYICLDGDAAGISGTAKAARTPGRPSAHRTAAGWQGPERHAARGQAGGVRAVPCYGHGLSDLPDQPDPF